MAKANIEIPPLFGLVLAGGDSLRMGTNKESLDYHGEEHFLHLHRLLESICDEVYISTNNSFYDNYKYDIKPLLDLNEYHGPYNGIMSAHQKYPEVAWLVLACDLPFLEKEDLLALVKSRNPEKPATAFTSDTTRSPEPLICIWEPHGLQMALNFIQKTGDISPKNFLKQAGVELVFIKNDEKLFNANTIEDYEFAKNKIKNGWKIE